MTVLPMASAFPSERLDCDGRHEKIRAGMRVSAEIKTGDRA